MCMQVYNGLNSILTVSLSRTLSDESRVFGSVFGGSGGSEERATGGACEYYRTVYGGIVPSPTRLGKVDSHSCLSLMLNSIGPLIFATARFTSLRFLEAHLLPLCSIASSAPFPTAREASRASNIHALR